MKKQLENNEKKKKILLGILIPTAVVGVALGVALPLYYCKNQNTSKILSASDKNWTPHFYTATSGAFSPGVNGDFVSGWENWLRTKDYDTIDFGAFTSISDNALFARLKDNLPIKNVIFSSDKCISIGNDAFNDCSSITSVSLPNSLTIIGRAAFANCTSLISLALSSSLINIGDNAFSYCSLHSFTYPTPINITNDSYVVIDENGNELTAVGTYSITNGFITQHKYVKTNPLNGLKSGGSLAIGNIRIPDNVTSLGDGAFWNCNMLASVILPNSLTSIADAGFRSCPLIKSITLPNTLATIGIGVFMNCSSLNLIDASYASAPKIGDNAFYNVASTGNVINTDSSYTSQNFLDLLKTKGLPSIGWTAI